MDKDTMVAVTADSIQSAIFDLPFANTAPIEWDDADWHQVRRVLAALYLPRVPRHQSGRTGAGEALREALSDSQSTLSAIKAECVARTEQEEDQMASHIAEICQTTMLTNAAALGTRS